MPLPPPPVPAKLREMLKDHPRHIEELQKALNSVNGRMKSVPPFEAAVWALEDCLSGFISEARAELAAAEASADPQVIGRATEKERLMRFARSSNIGMANLDDLWEHLQANERSR